MNQVILPAPPCSNGPEVFTVDLAGHAVGVLAVGVCWGAFSPGVS